MATHREIYNPPKSQCAEYQLKGRVHPEKAGPSAYNV